MYSKLRNLMTAPTLLYMFLLFHVTESTSERMLNDEESSNVYVASWAIQLQSPANDKDAQHIASTLGLKYEKILPSNYYLLTDERNQDLVDKLNEQIIETLESFPQVIWVEQQKVEHFDSRVQFTDPLWSKQSHHRTSQDDISQSLDKVWEEKLTGKGVTVIVIDNGVRGTHHELADRYDNGISVNITDSSSTSYNHGSYCAGVIAAEANNNLCGVGVAYNCTIGGIQLFVTSNASDHEEARAFYREDVNPSKVDIFSNSWGPTDNGRTIRGPGKLAREAFKLGAEKGRRGLGNIYVFACGNGAGFQDSCAFDGYVNSIYTIAVASIEKDGTVTGFSERCSAIMTAVYSSNMVTITGKNDTGCYSNFGRTSAAAATVSGILALALEANGNLTWRDMQHLVARSSNWDNVKVNDIQRNGGNFRVNENFGFGVLDALTLVRNAREWNARVPDQVICTMNVTQEVGTPRIPRLISVLVRKEDLNCEGDKLIKSLEHVQVKIDLEYTNRALLLLDVTSPSNTLSRILYSRQWDAIYARKKYSDLVVTSVHFWGESMLGVWKVDIKEDTDPGNLYEGRLWKMDFIFYGTEENITTYFENVCDTGRSGCHRNATCKYLGAGDYSCTCNEGFYGNGRNCTAEIICGTSRDDCNEHATCTNIGSGGYTCACNEGYTGSGKNCTEIICGTSRDDCHENATCTDIGPGDYKCTCNDGYTGSGKDCIENICDKKPCDKHATCKEDGKGSYKCTCNSRYTGDGKSCIAIWKIVIGVVFGCLSLVGFAVCGFVWYKRKRCRQSSLKPEPPHELKEQKKVYV